MNSLLLFKELLVILNMKDSRYSIKDLENLTKIKAHTIRIWEQRYGILNPQRTPTNIRYYVDSDLRKILNVNLLYTNGYKISKIAQLREEEIVQEVKNLLGNDSGRFSDIIINGIHQLTDGFKTFWLIFQCCCSRSTHDGDIITIKIIFGVSTLCMTSSQMGVATKC